MKRPPVIVAVVLVATCLWSGVPAAAAASRPAPAPVAASPLSVRIGAASVSGSIARDIGFPQCWMGLPGAASGVSGVLGTNDGRSFTTNPCLEAELAWAKRLPAAPAFYANTGNPGPARAKHWPLGRTTPRVCSSSSPNSRGCAYDYGWTAAMQSYSVAVDAAQRLHHVSRANAQRRAANVDWWLDVETMNSWQSSDGAVTAAGQLRDAETLRGEIDALHAVGIAKVGVYSTPYQWQTIVGTSGSIHAWFAGVPQWLAGYASFSGASEGCDAHGFTGGTVRMTQYLGRDGFDSDVVCATGDGD